MNRADETYGAIDDEGDTQELVAQLSQLAGTDPESVRQVVADVLVALDRASGGALREQLPDAIRLDIGLDVAVPRLDPAAPGHPRPPGAQLAS